MAESQLFSVGVDRLLQSIRPYGRDVSAFPPALLNAEARPMSGEIVQQWFVRIVDAFCEGAPKRSAIEDNIGIFTTLAWRNNRQLVYANMQTVVTSCDLDDFYLGGACDALYLRLDFNYRTLGNAFSHPLAHIHLEGDLSPRFALDGGTAGNIVVDYLEFLYRNFAHNKWQKWAEREWNAEFRRSANEDDENPFPMIMEAFRTSQFDTLRDFANQLSRIKRCFESAKTSASILAWTEQIVNSLNIPR